MSDYLESLGGWKSIWSDYSNRFSSKIFGKVFGSKEYNRATIDSFSETLKIVGLKYGRVIKKKRFKGKIDAGALLYDNANHPLIVLGTKTVNKSDPTNETIRIKLFIDLNETTNKVNKFRVVDLSVTEEEDWQEIEKLEDGLQ